MSFLPRLSSVTSLTRQIASLSIHKTFPKARFHGSSRSIDLKRLDFFKKDSEQTYEEYSPRPVRKIEQKKENNQSEDSSFHPISSCKNEEVAEKGKISPLLAITLFFLVLNQREERGENGPQQMGEVFITEKKEEIERLLFFQTLMRYAQRDVGVFKQFVEENGEKLAEQYPESDEIISEHAISRIGEDAWTTEELRAKKIILLEHVARSRGQSPVYTAIKHGCDDKVLLDHFIAAKPELLEERYSGKNPLQNAIRNNFSEDTAIYLIKKSRMQGINFEYEEYREMDDWLRSRKNLSDFSAIMKELISICSDGQMN